jgi:hypothetical protein
VYASAAALICCRWCGSHQVLAMQFDAVADPPYGCQGHESRNERVFETTFQIAKADIFSMFMGALWILVTPAQELGFSNAVCMDVHSFPLTKFAKIFWENATIQTLVQYWSATL